MDAHEFILLGLLALVTAVGMQPPHSLLMDPYRIAAPLTWPERWTVQPVCSGVEVGVACVPLTDIPSD
jgi:hypothetical protein